MLRQDVLVRQQRDGLRAVRADHPVHLEGVVRVELVDVGSTPSGSGSTIDGLRFGTTGRLRLCMGFSPSGGPTRHCGLDHSKHFPSRLGGNHEVITEPARSLWHSSHAARRCPRGRCQRLQPTVPGTGMTWALGSRDQACRFCAMEELDRQIVELLVKDGRMSYTDLGKATGLSTSAVHQRVRRLEQRGVIRGYAAVVDPEAVGLPLTAFISVKPFDPSAPDDIAERLAGVPEIEACHSVAGDENYILKVRVATPLELEHLLTRIRSLAGVSTRTTVVLSTPYEARPPRI